MKKSKLYTVPQAGKLIVGVSAQQIRKWVKKKEIVFIMCGNRPMITAKALYEKVGLDLPANVA
jgi:bifunctional N-acetylglucosamine-1-phosphate-uridyltransferase/glucosamine-1-phosphate-acetyltransferase GlmU-like protein